jgi:hypothetical protein
MHKTQRDIGYRTHNHAKNKSLPEAKPICEGEQLQQSSATQNAPQSQPSAETQKQKYRQSVQIVHAALNAHK